MQDGEILAGSRDLAPPTVDERVAEHPIARLGGVGGGDDPVQRREEVRANELEDEEPRRGEGDERRRHRGDGAPEHEAGEHAERERIESVRRHDESLHVEAARPDPPLQRVEGSAPPHDDRTRDRTCEQGRGREERGLRQKPATARDPLRPREAMRALLELAREQRRPDEQPGENG